MGRLVQGQVLSPALAPILRFRIAALFAAQLFDFGTFRLMIERHGIGAEANPIVAQGFIAFGLPIVVIAKISLVVLVGSILVLLGREAAARPVSGRLAAIVVLEAVAAGLIGGISNTRIG
jgi:hypothetical protein